MTGLAILGATQPIALASGEGKSKAHPCRWLWGPHAGQAPP